MSLDIAFNPPQFEDSYDGLKMRQLVEEIERLHSILTADTDDEGVASTVDSFNGRVGDIVPLQVDYDSFFLTPSEGNAAYSLLGHTHNSSDLTDFDFTGATDNDMLFRSGGSWVSTNGSVTWSGAQFVANAQANATSILTVGEETTIRGSLQRPEIRMSGEVGGVIQGFRMRMESNWVTVEGYGPSPTANMNYDFASVSYLSGTVLSLRSTGTPQFTMQSLSDRTSFIQTGAGSRLTWTLVAGTSVDWIGQHTHKLQDGSTLRIQDSGDTDWADYNHDGADFNTTYTNTTWHRRTGHTGTLNLGGAEERWYDSTDVKYIRLLSTLTESIIHSGSTNPIKFQTDGQFAFEVGGSNVDVLAGRTFSIFDSTGVDSAAFSHGGIDFNTVFTNTTEWNITGLTNFDLAAANIVTSGNVDGRDVSVDGATLDAHVALVNAHLDWSLDQGATDIHNGNITQLSITQHEAALTILESQITDGTLLARVGSAESITGVWTHTGNLNINDGTDQMAISAAAGTVTFQPTGGMSLLDINLTMQTNGINMVDAILDQPTIRDYGITEQVATVSANAVTVDLVNGNVASIDMDPATAAVVLTLSNPPATGTYGEVTLVITMGTPAHVMTWPGSITWQGGSPPTLTTVNNTVDLVHLMTVDAGVTWYGTFATAATPAAAAEVNDLTAAVTWDNIPIANVPTGTTASTVALGNHLHTGVYEPVDATIVRTTDPAWNATDWDTAFGWGNHAGLYSLLAHTHLLAAGATDVTATAAEVNLLDLSGLTAGWALIADTATSASWQALPASATTFDALTDTNFTAIAESNIAIYDVGTAKWRNFSISNDATMNDSGVLTVDPSIARLASPVFTGNPTAPTPLTADNDTSIATTAFVKAQSYITGYTEVDTLADVTGRGSTTATAVTFSGSISMVDSNLSRPRITDYSLTEQVAVVSANAVTVNLQNGNVASIDMDPATADVTLTLSNPPVTGHYGEVTILILMGTPAHGITWPGSVVWQGGSAPTLTTTNNVVDFVHLMTIDAGVTWYGTFATAAAAAGGLSNIVEDVTPQLGATLDANTFNIDMGTNVLTDTNLGQFITAFGWGDHSGVYLPLTGGTLTGSVIQAPASASISNQRNVTTNAYDVDIQYRIGGVLTALVRWDSSLNQFSWMDRDPSAVTAMSLDADTGDFWVNGVVGIENAEYIQWDNAAGTPQNMLTLWNDDRFYVGHSSFPMTIRATAVTIADSATLSGTTNSINGTTLNLSPTGNVNVAAQLQVTTGNSFRILDSVGTSYVNMSHDGTNLNLSAVSTTNIDIEGPVLRLLSGADLEIRDSANADAAIFSHDGVDFNLAFTGTTDWNVTGAAIYKFDSDIRIQDASGGDMLQIYDTGGAGALSDPFMSFRDSAFTRQGYIGFGSTGNQDLYINADIGDVRVVAAGGDIRLEDNVYMGGDAIGHFQTVTGNYGSVQVTGAEGSSGTWQGYSIGARHVFMDNGGTSVGIYNDTNNAWMFQASDGGSATIYWNGAARAVTASGGLNITGTLTVTATSLVTNLNADQVDSLHATSFLRSDTGDTFSGNLTSGGTAAILMADHDIRRAVLEDYSIESNVQNVSGTTATMTYSNGPAFQCDMEAATGNVTITLSGGPPAGTYGEMIIEVTQDTTVRTLAWAGGTFKWPGGTAIAVTAVANAIDIFHFSTWDGGATWYGSAIQAMS